MLPWSTLYCWGHHSRQDIISFIGYLELLQDFALPSLSGNEGFAQSLTLFWLNWFWSSLETSRYENETWAVKQSSSCGASLICIRFLFEIHLIYRVGKRISLPKIVSCFKSWIYHTWPCCMCPVCCRVTWLLEKTALSPRICLVCC